MPRYQFVNEAFGVSIEVFMLADKRQEELVLRRVQVPDSLMIGTGAKPPTLGSQIMQGWKKAEEKGPVPVVDGMTPRKMREMLSAGD